MDKKVLIHICCAPDAVYSIPSLRSEYRVSGFFFNPNIHPQEEYLKRLESVKSLSKIQRWDFIQGEYSIEKWEEKVKGLETIPEGRERCLKCIEFLLLKTAQKAKEKGFDLFATTLTNSPRKQIETIEEAAYSAEKKEGIKYLRTDLKKKEGYLKSVKICKYLDIYRQNYCGCIYSMKKE